jgi:putative ABC transport system substrate-binding protein
MKRRDFITLLGGAVVAWPLGALAQQAGKLPTIGFLGANPSIESQRVAAFVQRLRELGWIEGRTVSIEYRWAEGRSERYAENAAELVQLNVDVIVRWCNASIVGSQERDQDDPDRYRQCWRSCGGRARRKSCETGRQRDGKLLDDH